MIKLSEIVSAMMDIEGKRVSITNTTVRYARREVLERLVN